jgi:phosphoadenosine phosphosulfate reductase
MKVKDLDVKRLEVEFEKKNAEEVIRWGWQTFKGELALANSLGAEDVVLTDMVVKINPQIRIFTLDTGRLPQESYEVWERLEEKYKIHIEPYFPEAKDVEEMVKEYGPNLFYKSTELRRLCCQARKVKPLHRALSGILCWVCGLRREQAATRTGIKKIEIDKIHNGILKLNPLADWTEKQVWDYIKVNQVPYNRLHDKGYPSIGCAPCTRSVKPGEDIRAGRWWWERPEQKECGLHICKTDR